LEIKGLSIHVPSAKSAKKVNAKLKKKFVMTPRWHPFHIINVAEYAGPTASLLANAFGKANSVLSGNGFFIIRVKTTFPLKRK